MDHNVTVVSVFSMNITNPIVRDIIFCLWEENRIACNIRCLWFFNITDIFLHNKVKAKKSVCLCVGFPYQKQEVCKAEGKLQSQKLEEEIRRKIDKHLCAKFMISIAYNTTLLAQHFIQHSTLVGILNVKLTLMALHGPWKDKKT